MSRNYHQESVDSVVRGRSESRTRAIPGPSEEPNYAALYGLLTGVAHRGNPHDAADFIATALTDRALGELSADYCSFVANYKLRTLRSESGADPLSDSRIGPIYPGNDLITSYKDGLLEILLPFAVNDSDEGDGYLRLVRPESDPEGYLKRNQAEIVRLGHTLGTMVMGQLKATTDNLTGIRNQGEFRAELNKLDYPRRASDNKPYAIFMIDGNGIKQINDTYGHRLGDDAIKKLATALFSCTRDHDIIARNGGDEFVIIAKDCTEEGMEIVAERLEETLKDLSLEIDGANVTLAASIGYAHNSQTRGNANDVLEMADHAMYSLKDGDKTQSKTAKFNFDMLKLGKN